MTAQLVFDLTAPPALGREDFFVSEANRLAVAALRDPGRWPSGKLVLVGPEGSGKTHLAGIWAEERGAAILAARGVSPAMETGAALVVEDGETVAGDAEAERALLHLHNRAMAEGTTLLLTAARPPREWGIRLADLASRMEATATASLAPPDDALLAAVLVKLFADRQLAVPPSVIRWLVPRMERSFVAARSVVAGMDRLALATGRPAGRALAAEVLDRIGGAGQ